MNRLKRLAERLEKAHLLRKRERKNTTSLHFEANQFLTIR